MSTGSEDANLENVLQQIFTECEASVSITDSPDSTVPIGDGVPVSGIVVYVQEQLPTCSIDNLVELWKCLVAVSTNDRVNLHQFKEATKRWIAKVQQVQSAQDGNNNHREKLYLVSDADSSMKTMAVDKDIMEFDLRVKLRELHEENVTLRDELERHEGLIDNLKQQYSIIEKQLDRYVQKCQQLEKENDELRDQLNEFIKKEKTMAMALQKYTKEHQNLLKQLETAEIEVQAIPSLKEKMEKVTKEKMDCMKRIAKLQEEFDEKEDDCVQLKTTITELEDSSINMKKTYEYTIRNLREKNRLLADENTELQSLSLNGCPTGERLSLSPIPDTDGCCTHSTPYKLEKVPLQDSLYAELKASGFTAECGSNDSRRQELEEELDEYDATILTILEQLEKVKQIFVTMRGSADDVSQFNPQDTDAGATCNIDVLKHKAAFLLNMATEEITRRNTMRDSSTQLRADPVNAIDSLGPFGVRSFRDLLSTHARPYLKAETDLRSITSHCVNNEDDHDDSFSRVIKMYLGVENRFRIIEPIIEELHDIIESTLGTFADRKDCSLSGNSRYRSSHTLPSSSQSLQDSPWRTFDCQYPESPFAQGNGLTREDCEKSAPFVTEARDVSDQENPAHSEVNRSCEMSKVSSVLQTDAKASATSEEEKTSAGSFQVPEVSSADNPANPRRKISVYCRSFDVVSVQDPRENHPGSNLEVRQSESSKPDDPPAQIDRTAPRDQNSKPGAKYPFNHVYRNVKSDSDSSNGSSPQKQLDTLLDNEPPVGQPVPRKVCLAPTRLRFPQEAESELSGTAEASSRASPVSINSTESDIPNSPPSPVVNGGRKKDDDASAHSSSKFVVNKCEVEVKDAVLGSKSCTNENISQKHSVPNRCLFPRHQIDSGKIADSKDPHSQASVLIVDGESQSRIERPVDSQMSSREDGLAGSDSGRKPAPRSGDRSIDRKVANEVGNAVDVASSTSLSDPVPTKVVPRTNLAQSNEKARQKDLLKQEKREIALITDPRRKDQAARLPRLLNARLSYSEGENLDRLECRYKRKNAPLIPEEDQPKVFPSLADVRLRESEVASLTDLLFDSRGEEIPELELQKRYIAFSLCLCIDRVTLPRRVAMSLRQRDQSERNLSCEVRKMQQDIQELAPLCTDRESVERVERVRHQLDMIVRCSHRVSCAAETLGAVHQERRVSRAVLLADRYLQVVQSRCEKLIANVAETKRILTENNIVIEENPSELGDELPRIRYRSGTPANNRMMMARRRASVATMSRPMSSTQDMTKDIVRQRNSVSGRITLLRRSSFISESSKWEVEKLDRTESSNSISELRGIFEQAEGSRRSSREENNILRLSHSNSQSTVNCAIVDNEVSTNVKQEASPELSVNESINSANRSCVSSLSRSFQSERNSVSPWHTLVVGVLILFFGFYIIQAMSVNNVCDRTCNPPLKEVFARTIEFYTRNSRRRNAEPYPM